MLNKELLDVLACPKCKGDLGYEDNKLVCSRCRLRFAVLEKDVPNMLIEDAESF